MILNIKVFTREFMHYALQEKICNTLKHINTRKEMQFLEEQLEEGSSFHRRKDGSIFQAIESKLIN